MTKKPSFLLLFLLISFGSVTAVLFTPALPEIQQDFHLSENQAQLTVTIFLVGYALGQLLYGPLANGLGRIKALYIGIVLEILSCLLCLVSGLIHAFWLFMLARLFMALGASCGLKMTFTLISDCYDEQESRRLISHLMMAFAITPGVGIALGGLLTEHVGWECCFVALGLYGVLLLLFVLNTQETASQLDPTALRMDNIFKKYINTSKNLSLLYGSTLMGCGTTFVYVFASLAPFIAMSSFHLNPVAYGNWNLLPPIGIIVGSQLAAKISKKFSSLKAITFGLSIIFPSVLWMFLAFLYKTHEAIYLFLPLTFCYVGISFIFGNASSLAMHSTEDKSSASAIMNFINMGIATVSVLLLSCLTNIIPQVLPTTFLILLGLAIITTILLDQNKKKFIVE